MFRSRAEQLARLTLGALSIVLVLADPPILGAQGEFANEFAGFYSTRDASEIGDHVVVSIDLFVKSYVQFDVPAAVISLRSSSDSTVVLGTTVVGEIVNGSVKRASGTFTVPKSEFETWPAVQQPFLTIDYFANGEPVSSAIRVAWLPSLPAEE